MRVTITGGAGFIGTNVASEWALRGAQVAILDNLSRSGVEANIEWLRGRYGDAIEFTQADACDPEAVDNVVRGSDLVYHFASQVAVTKSIEDPLHDFRSNAESTLVALEAVRQHAPEAPFFYTSTNKVYGEMTDIYLDERPTRYAAPDFPHGLDEIQPLDFHSPYGCSKGAGDQYVLDYARTFGLRTVVFRMSCIYGMHQWGTTDQGWVVHFVRSVLERKPITICGDGKQVRDLLFIKDLVNAFMRAYDFIDSISGEVFNIGGGENNSVSLIELVELLEEETCTKARLEYDDWRLGDQKYYISQNLKALEMFEWKPSTSVEDGIREVINWLETRELADE